MPEVKHKVINAMFDIKPVDDLGNIDASKISGIQMVLNLGRKFQISKNGKIRLKKEAANIKNKVLREKKESIVKDFDPRNEFESFLNQDFDTMAELASIGAKIHKKNNFKPRYKLPILRQNQGSSISQPHQSVGEIGTIAAAKFNENEEIIPVLASADNLIEENYQDILAQINLRVPIKTRNEFIGKPKKIDPLNMWVEDFSKKSSDFHSKKFRLPKLSKIKISKQRRTKFLVIGFGLTLLPFFSHYGSSVRNELIIEGNSAVANLENAGQNIKKMDFVSASGNFAQAYQEFSKAGDNMNFMGAGIISWLSDLPTEIPGFAREPSPRGAGKLKSAKNLVEAGKMMANAGQAISDAMGELAKTNLILNPLAAAGSDVSIGQISASLKKALTLSQKNLGKAKQLLADVDDSSIPEGKKASFEEFKSKLPLFEKLINDSADYSKFLENFIGTKGTKKYLILFQNPSELRPTGGFPGTYGVVSFKNGKLQDFKIDDVYNLDGQLKELIIPPIQLRHITPNWGMRDANWFVDFPTSAKKIIQFYKKESGDDIDGVITFSPKIVAKMLAVVGPVQMPDYNLSLDSSNLFSALQEEVEYKGDRKQPKKIVMDLAPKLLKKLYSAPQDKWLEVFNILVSSMEQKDILMYFRDLNLESFSVDKGFSGQIKNTDSDYLMATFTNVKGSKTDSVMDTSLKVAATTENGNIKHKVLITRTHNGGGNKYGFYNKQSPTYVRVLVPEKAEFVGLAGNSRPDFKPLIDYASSGFKKDDDLTKLEEESYTDKETGMTIYKEAGKTEFGFWMIINPGETKTVNLEYMVPLSGEQAGYQLYIQKQPSLDINDFKFYMDGKLYFSGRLDKDMVISPRP